MLQDQNIGAPFGGSSVRAPDPREIEAWTIADLIAQAERASAREAFGDAASLYKAWIALHPHDPHLHAAYFNHGVALAKSGDRAGAINANRECLRLKPDFQPPYINLGRLLEDEGRTAEAVAQWKALVDNLGDVTGPSVRHKLTALEQMARVLEAHQLDGPAEDALRLSLDINPAQPAVIQHYIALRQRQCVWPAVEGWETMKAEALMAGISPLSLANLSNDPLLQLARAARYYREFVGPIEPRPWPDITERASGKIRVGYVSSDLREHAVGFAMTDVFEQHDRGRFEIFAYYCGIEREDGIRARIRRSADQWVDINALTDEQAAARIRADGVDILVDLNGFTKSARTRVFALRPAPIAVNWFGFPGTMGSPDHPYLLADPWIVPEGAEPFYSEKVVRLSCYQPNDRKRIVSPAAPSRAVEGLPENAFVFCCLNGAQKLTPAMFAAWMKILSATPGGVLWLLGDDEPMRARLRDRARAAGVEPERLIFAPKRANPEHLARYALADLFLDTFPYGAHTTAADAMWMGVPVVTLPGRTFASRVCASLAAAAGIGELVASDVDQYVELAVALGREPARAHALKRRLLEARSVSRLFDTPALVRELEDAYRAMWLECREGRRPIPDLTNLAVFQDIGLRADLGEPPDRDILAAYSREMAKQHLLSPLPADGRAWAGGR